MRLSGSDAKTHQIVQRYADKECEGPYLWHAWNSIPMHANCGAKVEQSRLQTIGGSR